MKKHRLYIVIFCICLFFPLLYSCDDFSLYSLKSGTEPLAIYPNDIDIGFGETCTFTGSGGEPPYSFSMSPNLVSFGTIDEETGEYTAPNNKITVHIILTDSADNTDIAKVDVMP